MERVVLIVREQNKIYKLLRTEFNWEDLKEKPQIKTKYGLFIYHQTKVVLIKETKKRGGMSTTNYKKVNAKSYKNLIWLDRMYERKIKEGKQNIFKVIIPLEFPNGYKLYDQDENFYGTVIDQDDIFLYIVPKNKDKVHPFVPKSFLQNYIKAAAGKAGLKVPLEFVKDFERD